jgi:hypothetical protein
LAEKFSGPFRIIRFKGPNNAEIVVNNGRKMIVNLQRLRPFLSHDLTASNDLDIPVNRKGQIDGDNLVADKQTQIVEGGEGLQKGKRKQKEKQKQKQKQTISPYLDIADNSTTQMPKQQLRKDKSNDTAPHTRAPHTPSLSLSGPLTRAKAKALQTNVGLGELVTKLSLIMENIAQQILAIKKRSKKRAQTDALDPYKYGAGCEVGDSSEQEASPTQSDEDSSDFETETEDEVDDAVATPGRWAEKEGGWKSWIDDDDEDAEEAGNQEETGNEFYHVSQFVRGTKPLDHPFLDRIIRNGGPTVEQFKQDLLGQQKLFEIQFLYLTKRPGPKDERKLEELSKEGKRLKELFARFFPAGDSTATTEAATPAAPKKKHTILSRHLKGRRVSFHTEDEDSPGDDDDVGGARSYRTRPRKPEANLADDFD